MLSQEGALKSKSSFSQNFYYLIFPFLNINTLLTCKLVNKKWCSEVEKSYNKREKDLYKSLIHPYSSNILSLKEEELAEIYNIILSYSKCTPILLKSILMDKRHLREIQYFNAPPYLIFLLIKIYALLVLDLESWKQLTSWRQYCAKAINEFIFIKSSLKTLSSPGFILTLTKEKLKIAQTLLKEETLEWNRLKYMVTNSDHLNSWILQILEIADKRWSLDDNVRETLDNIFRNISEEFLRELYTVRKLIEQIKLRPLKKAFNKKLEICFVKFDEKLKEISEKAQEKNLDILTTKLAIENLKFITKNLEKEIILPSKN